MRNVIISRETNPYYNIAAEHELFLRSGNSLRLFLWQNSPSVIIGRNQNLYAECDLDFLQKNSINPVRRFSGGGAVYHDLGNVNYTFIINEKLADEGFYFKFVSEVMADLGFACEKSGRNDLLIDGRKFSGTAYYSDGENFMFHGTILVNVNLDMLLKSLTPSKLKLESKGVESVKSRVLNLSEIDCAVSAEKVIKAFEKRFGEKASYIDRKTFKPKLEDRLWSDEWLFGESPRFDLELQRRLSAGNFTVLLSVCDNMISYAKIFTDSLYALDLDECADSLAGHRFDENYVWTIVEKQINKNGGV